MSVGQEFHNARRVVVLIEDWDGQQHGFEVTEGSVRWDYTGLGYSSLAGSGSTAKLVVEGRFQRRRRSGVPLKEKEIDRGD